MKNILYRLLLLPLLLVAWGARAQAPAWLSATAVPANVQGMQVQAVATNAAGDIFVTGAYTGSVTFGGTTLTSKAGANSSQDAYVAKWSTANSSWSWAVSAGGDDLDTGYAIAVNGTSVYVTGQFTGNSAAFNGVALTSAGAADVFVAQLIDGGTSVTNGGAVSAGGTSTDRGLGIAFSGNNVYVTGFINGNATISGTSSTGAGSQDIFVAKYVDGGTTLTNGGALRAGSSSAERGNAIAVNGSNIYVGAYFNGPTATFGNNNASPYGTTSLTNANTASSSSDVAIIKYTDTGSLSFSSVVQAGGSDNERVTGIAVSGANVYVTGYYASPSLTIAGTTLANAGGFSGGSAQLTQNIFVAKYTDGGTLAGAGAKRAYGSGGGDEAGNAIAVNGNTVYVTGFYSSPTTFDEGATTVSISGDTDIFVAKYTDAGGLNLNGAIGGGGNSAVGNPEGGNGIAATSSQAIVGGYIVPGQGNFGNAAVNSSGGGFFARVGVAPTTVTSIVPVGTSPTNAASVQFTVTFAASVTGLTTANFTTANGTGVTGSSVTSVSGSGTTYTVTVNTGSGSGTLGLTLANDTGLTPGISNEPFTGSPLYTIDKTAPTVTITSSTGASGSTSSAATFAYTVTFSEAVTGFVQGDLTVGNGTISGFSGSGTTYTFNVTPTANGAVTVNVPANVAQDAVGNGNTAASPYSITYAAPNTTVVSVTRLTPSPTATTQVRYSVVFAASITGITVSNFTVTTTGSVSGTSVSSVSGSGTTYTVTVNTGTGDGTLRLDVVNSTGTSPTISNVPYTAGEVYTITKSFAAAPTLRIQGAGSASGNSDVTAFVDVVQVLQSGTSTVVANGVQNGSFETNNVPAGSYLYQSQGVVASPWTFGVQAGVSRNNSAFGSTAADGDAVTLLQSNNSNNGSVSQSLAVPTGSYQVSFRAIQRNYTSLDQRLNVFVNDVFVGNIQPNNIPTYDTFTSASFNVTAPALTATVSTTSTSPTSTSPIPFSVSFSQSVGTTFTASDVTVTGGGAPTSFSGSGAGPYTFNVTPSGAGTVTVSLAAGVANDANNTGNSASNSLSVQFQAPTIVVAPVSLPQGTQGTAYSQALTASGGSAPYTYAITAGALPSGLALTSAGVLSGTPTTSGTFNFTVTATDNSTAPGPYRGSRAYTLLINTQPVTATPTVTAPANGSLLSTTTPTYQGTAPAGSTVTVYVDGAILGTTTATGGNFSLTQPTALAQGSHTVYATAQTSGSAMSANSNTNTFTVDTVSPTVAISSSAGASGGSTSTSPIPFTVTFSESVTGFSASGITVTNGTIGAVTGSGTTYTFSVTPTTVNTATTVTVAANAAQDQAGNGNTASSTFSLTYTVTLTSWTGAVSTDWFTSGNWTAGVPTTTIDATIPTSAPRYPLITAGTAPVRSLTVNFGATLTQTGGALNVTGNLTNNSTLALTGGTVTLGSSTLSNILGSGNTRFWNLTIGASGAQSSTSASTSVQRVATLNGSFATQGNPFILESNASGTAMLVNNGSNVVSGNVTVQRYITPDLNPNLGYRHFSSAISTATVASLATGSFSPVVNPAYNTSATPATVRPFPTVYGYDQSRLATATNNLPTFDKGWFSPSALSSSLTVGQGYTVNLVANQTLSLTGPQNNGNVPLTLSRNSDATAADAGLALVGNPYPSPLDWSSVVAADRPNLDGVIYVFTSNDPANPYAGSYSFYNNNIGNISPMLPLGQGFFVRVSQGQTSATLTLKNSHRPTTYSSTTYRRTAAETRPLVQLSLKATGSSVSDDAFVYFEKGATDGFDSQFDAIKLPNTNGLNISTSITGKQLSIDGRDELGKVQRVVPLAVGVPAAGTYTFTTAQLLNLDTTPVYLRDLQLGTLTDLRLTPSYQFTVTNASALITNRFELVFSPQQALATVSAALSQQVALYPNPAKTAAFVELPASLGRQAVTATLLDALGREVRSVVLPAQGAVAHQLDLHELATGVYALRLSTNAGVVVKRLTVE